MDPDWTKFLSMIEKKGFEFWSSKDVTKAYQSVYDLYCTTSRKSEVGEGEEKTYQKELEGIRHEGFRSHQEGDLVLVNGDGDPGKGEWRVYVHSDAKRAPAIMKVLVKELFPTFGAMRAAKICDTAELANTRLDTIVIYTDSEKNAKAIATKINDTKAIRDNVAAGTVAMAQKVVEGVSIGESPRSWKMSFGTLRSYACAAATVAVCGRGKTYFTVPVLEDATRRALPEFGLMDSTAARNGPNLQPKNAHEAQDKMTDFVKAYRRMAFPVGR